MGSSCGDRSSRGRRRRRCPPFTGVPTTLKRDGKGEGTLEIEGGRSGVELVRLQGPMDESSSS